MKIFRTALPVCLFAAAAALAADTVTKEVTGEAPILNGDKVRAADDAKKAALREAVEQVAGTMVSAATITQNSVLMSDRIFSHSDGYVKTYSILNKVEDAGVMKVTVRAEVGTAQLDKDLMAVQQLVKRLEQRKMIIVTTEQSIDPKGTIMSSQVLASVLNDKFKADGWIMLDPNSVNGKLRQGAGIGPAEAKEIADTSKTDYVIYGNVNYRYQPPDAILAGSPVYLVSGEYDLTLFATDNHSVIAKIAGKFVTDVKRGGVTPLISYERTAFDITKTEAAGIVGQVRSKLVEHLANAEQNGNRVVMNVNGLSEYTAVQNFKKILQESISGVQDVRAGTFGGGKAQFDLTFIGTTDDLATRLGGKTFKGKKISVTGVTGNTVEVSLAK